MLSLRPFQVEDRAAIVVNGNSQHVIQGNLIEFTDMSLSKKAFEALVLG